MGSNKETPTGKTDDDVEIIDDDPDVIDTKASYQEWLKDTRNRGFKRSNPASSAERVSPSSHSQQVKKTTYARATVTRANPQYQQRSDTASENSQNFVRYCHNWNNLGKCNFEGCIFVHESAPVCTFDGNCTRPKCMYAHKKQNMNFLSKKFKPPVHVHPWQGMGGPWPTPFAFQHNPWMNQGMNRRN